MITTTQANKAPEPVIGKVADRETTAQMLAERHLKGEGGAGGVWSAPGRVNLIGEHVDYAGGMCLPVAIPQRTFASVKRRQDGVVRIRSEQEPEAGQVLAAEIATSEVKGWHRYVLGVLWAMSETPGVNEIVSEGLDILIDGHVPYGSGLSSSAALECAVATALSDLAGAPVDRANDSEVRRQLVNYTIKAENEYVGAPTGGLDQSASLRCSKGAALYLDCSTWETVEVPVDTTAAGLTLLVINTNVSHAHADGGYGERRQSVDEAARRLGVPNLRAIYEDGRQNWALNTLKDSGVLQRRAKHVLTEMARTVQARIVLGAGDWSAFGALMNRSHASLRDDFEVSCAELDATVETALHQGAIGARMTGGGFGGSAIALVPTPLVEMTAAAIQDRFASETEWASPDFYIGTPSDGAGRDL